MAEPLTCGIWHYFQVDSVRIDSVVGHPAGDMEENPTPWNWVLSWWSEVGSESEFHQGLKTSHSGPTAPLLPWSSMYSKVSTDFGLFCLAAMLWPVFWVSMSQHSSSLGPPPPLCHWGGLYRYICSIWFFPQPHWFDRKYSTLDSCSANHTFCLGNLKFGSRAASPSCGSPWKWLL